MNQTARFALVIGDSLDAATLHALGDACARLGAGLRVWDSRKPEPCGRPALVVAGLAAGERRLSDETLELADRRFPGTQVLLVCNEPLVRPMLTLQQGRITLIEPPATVERMASRLRLLLTDEPECDGDDRVVGLPSLEPRAYSSEEFRRAGWWAAGLACAGSDGNLLPPRPWLGLQLGLTAVLASPDSRVDDRAVARAIEILRHDAETGDQRELLARTLGEQAGLIHLTGDGMSWVIYWPCAGQPLWLFSTQRLPRWSSLTQTGDRTLWRLPAVAGDVIAGLSSAESFAEAGSALPSTKVVAAMLDGGPALVALCEAVQSASPRPFSCVVAEVR